MLDNNDKSLMNVHPLNPTNQITKANSLIEGNYSMSLPESKIMEAVLSCKSSRGGDGIGSDHSQPL